MDGRMIEGKTLVRIWVDRAGMVYTDFDFAGMDRVMALGVNLRLDQMKALVVGRFDDELGLSCDGLDGLGVPDGG